jgi:hypothetical protein
MVTLSKSKIPKIKSKNVFYQIFFKIDETIKLLNTNTLFVGLMMFVMNIASRFVNIKLSRSMEGYMKFSFSKDILVFAIAFIGTRDLYWALIITLIFILFMDYLFNENSSFCCLPESFTSKHIALLDESMDSSGNSMGKGGSGIMGMGVPVKDSSISGAPGLGYSIGSKDSQGKKMAIDDWGKITEEEKKKISEVLLEMRGDSSYSSIGSGVGNSGNTNRRLNDGPISSLYSSYR